MEPMLKAGENQMTEDVMVIDPAFLDRFDFPLVKGDRSKVGIIAAGGKAIAAYFQ